MTQASITVLENLRSTEQLSWYVVPLLIFVIYVYSVEMEKKNYSAVLLGIIGFSGELIWEMMNALVLHFTRFAPLWCTPGKSSFILYAGYNLEIGVFFALAPLLIIKMLPGDKKAKLLGLPNRLMVPLLLGITCVVIELLLNRAGILVWSYSFWSFPNIFLIALVYISPWFLVVYSHDKVRLEMKKLFALIVPCAALLCHVLFAEVLKWI